MPHDLEGRQHRLKRLFTAAFTVMDIAEPLLSFDVQCSADDTARFMSERSLRVIGVRRDGRIAGYAVGDELKGGRLADHLHEFPTGAVLSEDADLPTVFQALIEDRYCVVSILGEVCGIVSRSDIGKPPVRMWLFGMVTILETYLSRALRERLPGDSWRDRVPAGRLAKAETLRAERLRRGEQVELVDCLQLPDKAQALLKDRATLTEFGFESRRESERTIKALESLRNNLAHAQDIVESNWDTILDLSTRLDRILTRV